MLSLFSCCFHRRHASDNHPDQPDERTYLIPASSELASPTAGLPSASLTDHQRMRDRMGSIVRAKESKMVNVNARLPFNLHNLPSSSDAFNPQPSSSSQSLSLSSSSRSVSRIDNGGTHATATPRPHPHIQVHVGAPLSALSSSVSASRPPLSHHASQDDISRSSSMASQETGDGPLARRRDQPILGLRLVRIPLPDVREATGRRGRKKKKAVAEESGDAEEACRSVSTPTSQYGQLDLAIDLGEEGTPRPPAHNISKDGTLSRSVDTDESLDTPRGEKPHDLHGHQPEGAASDVNLEICISPASTSSADASGHAQVSGGKEEGPERQGMPVKMSNAQEFALRDEGPITISWGD